MVMGSWSTERIQDKQQYSTVLIGQPGAGDRRDRQCIGTQAGPEEGVSDTGDTRAGDDGARGLVPERELVYVYDASGNVSGGPCFDRTCPQRQGKTQSLQGTSTNLTILQGVKAYSGCLV